MWTIIGSRCGERRFVAASPDVRLDRVKEPQRRVRGVIESFVAPVGKHVRDETVANVVRERPQNERRFPLAARRAASAPRG